MILQHGTLQVSALCWVSQITLHLSLMCCVQHGHRLGDGATRDAARLLVASLLHYAPTVRRVAKKSAQECVVSALPLAESFIAALQEYLATAPTGPVRRLSKTARMACWRTTCSSHADRFCVRRCTLFLLQAPLVAPAAPGEDAVVSGADLSDRFMKAQTAMSPLPAQSGASVLPPLTAADFLLAAHHPVITEPLSHRRSYWCAVASSTLSCCMSFFPQVFLKLATIAAYCRQFVTRKACLDECRQALRRRLGSLTHTLSTAEALDHMLAVATSEQSSLASREAACWALGSMMAEDGPAVYRHLLPALAALLDRRKHDALSPTEIKIFQTPAGWPSGVVSQTALRSCTWLLNHV